MATQTSKKSTQQKSTQQKSTRTADARLDVRVREEASRVFYAGVGVNDLLVERVREAVADVQKSLKGLDLDPKELRERIEARLTELQRELKGYPTRIESLIDDNVEAATGRYEELIQRGEGLVGRIRRQEATQTAASEVKTAVTKAKTTRTQAAKASTPAKKSAKAAQSSAKATATSATKAAASAAEAVADAAEKVGD